MNSMHLLRQKPKRMRLSSDYADKRNAGCLNGELKDSAAARRIEFRRKTMDPDAMTDKVYAPTCRTG